MHTKERAYRCHTRHCGSLSSKRVTRPRSVILKRQSDDDRARTYGKSRSTKNSPVRCPTGLAEHESTLNLMSETLMSVANKLEKVFNNPKEGRPVSRPTIKRVYVIKFDKNTSEATKSTPKTRKRYTQVSSVYQKKMNRRLQANFIGGERGRGQHAGAPKKTFLDDDTLMDVSQSINDNENLLTLPDEYERSSNDRTGSSNDRSRSKDHALYPSTVKKTKLLAEDSFADLINDVTSAQEQRERPASGSGRKYGPKYRVLLRERIPIKDPRRNRIPDIFNAILKEIGSVSIKNRKTDDKQREKSKLPKTPKVKTLSEVLESEESLITSEYTIPRSMIKKEAIDRLQTLLDRARKRSRAGRSSVSAYVSEDQRDNQRDNQTDSESLEWKVPKRLPTTMSCYAGLINDHEADNIGRSSSVVSGPICRICHGRHGTLVKPCGCRGTLAYVHVECLQVWLTEREVNFCELCNFTFRVIQVPEYKIIPSIAFWYKFAATNQQRRMMIVDLSLAVILLPLLVFLTFFVRSFTNDEKIEYEDDEFEDDVIWHFGQATVKVALFLLIVAYVAGVLVRINHHLSAWFSWYVNKNVTVVLEDRRQSRGEGTE